MIIYNYKGLEIDDSDISILKNNDILYLEKNQKPFLTENYINEYQKIEYIKEGGYGKVYKAKHNLTQKIVAIKKINLKNIKTSELYNISRESSYLFSLKHNNIIKIHNSYLTLNELCIVMKYAEGGELTNIINKDKGLDENICKFYFRQIYEAVRFIHNNNIVHRDLKPNNILFKDKERKKIVIIDFGISGLYNKNVKEEIKAGTVYYVPPEIALKKDYDSDPKIDIWSLGIILYLLKFGKFPFDGKNREEILKNIGYNTVTFPNNNLSTTLFNLLLGLLEKNPIKRININSNLFELWFEDNIYTPIKIEGNGKTYLHLRTPSPLFNQSKRRNTVFYSTNKIINLMKIVPEKSRNDKKTKTTKLLTQVIKKNPHYMNQTENQVNRNKKKSTFLKDGIK
jgi:myosin-light-chain kinase